MRKGETLIECLAAAAIVVMLVALFLALFAREGTPDHRNDDPSVTRQLSTGKHDGHWWILGRDTFIHHPDCPCAVRPAEAGN
jgi:hypothetical protein